VSSLLLTFSSWEQETGPGSLFESAANNPERKTRLEREIDTIDRQIDQLVYELYELTEKEIKIVEEVTSR
jgi:predicted  nucleic acid-binding Zn-ribbon protein